MSEPSKPGWPPSWLLAGLIVVIVAVWAIQEVASVAGFGPTPDPALTLAISGVIGALAASGLKR